MLFIVSGIERPRAKCGMIAILWVKVLIFQGAKPIFNVGSLSNEYKMQFSLWCLAGVPLMLGADIRTIKPEMKGQYCQNQMTEQENQSTMVLDGLHLLV